MVSDDDRNHSSPVAFHCNHCLQHVISWFLEWKMYVSMKFHISKTHRRRYSDNFRSFEPSGGFQTLWSYKTVELSHRWCHISIYKSEHGVSASCHSLHYQFLHKKSQEMPNDWLFCKINIKVPFQEKNLKFLHFQSFFFSNFEKKKSYSNFARYFCSKAQANSLFRARPAPL